jgi:hypothetical protein
MSDSEVAMLAGVAGLCRSVPRLLSGQTLWEAVRGKVMSAPGAAQWAEEDLVCLYNAAMSLSSESISCLVEMHFQWVNPTALKALPSFFNDISTLPADAERCKLALMVRHYMPDEKKKGALKEIERTGQGPCISKAVKPEHTKSLRSPDAASFLASMQSFISKVMTTYSRQALPGVQVIEQMRGLHTFLAKCGGVLRERKDISKGNVLETLELKLRRQLKAAGGTTDLPHQTC